MSHAGGSAKNSTGESNAFQNGLVLISRLNLALQTSVECLQLNCMSVIHFAYLKRNILNNSLEAFVFLALPIAERVGSDFHGRGTRGDQLIQGQRGLGESWAKKVDRFSP